MPIMQSVLILKIFGAMTNKKIMLSLYFCEKEGESVKIALFDHNQVAYDAAVAMPGETGKAAIVRGKVG